MSNAEPAAAAAAALVTLAITHTSPSLASLQHDLREHYEIEKKGLQNLKEALFYTHPVVSALLWEIEFSCDGEEEISEFISSYTEGSVVRFTYATVANTAYDGAGLPDNAFIIPVVESRLGCKTTGKSVTYKVASEHLVEHQIMQVLDAFSNLISVGIPRGEKTSANDQNSSSLLPSPQTGQPSLDSKTGFPSIYSSSEMRQFLGLDKKKSKMIARRRTKVAGSGLNKEAFNRILWPELFKAGWTSEIHHEKQWYWFPPGVVYGQKGCKNRRDYFDSVNLIVKALKAKESWASKFGPFWMNPGYKDMPKVLLLLQVLEEVWDELALSKGTKVTDLAVLIEKCEANVCIRLDDSGSKTLGAASLKAVVEDCGTARSNLVKATSPSGYAQKAQVLNRNSSECSSGRLPSIFYDNNDAVSPERYDLRAPGLLTASKVPRKPPKVRPFVPKSSSSSSSSLLRNANDDVGATCGGGMLREKKLEVGENEEIGKAAPPLLMMREEKIVVMQQKIRSVLVEEMGFEAEIAENALEHCGSNVTIEEAVQYIVSMMSEHGNDKLPDADDNMMNNIDATAGAEASECEKDGAMAEEMMDGIHGDYENKVDEIGKRGTERVLKGDLAGEAIGEESRQEDGNEYKNERALADAYMEAEEGEWRRDRDTQVDDIGKDQAIIDSDKEEWV